MKYGIVTMVTKKEYNLLDINFIQLILAQYFITVMEESIETNLSDHSIQALIIFETLTKKHRLLPF